MERNSEVKHFQNLIELAFYHYYKYGRVFLIIHSIYSIIFVTASYEDLTWLVKSMKLIPIVPPSFTPL